LAMSAIATFSITTRAASWASICRPSGIGLWLLWCVFGVRNVVWKFDLHSLLDDGGADGMPPTLRKTGEGRGIPSWTALARSKPSEGFATRLDCTSYSCLRFLGKASLGWSKRITRPARRVFYWGVNL